MWLIYYGPHPPPPPQFASVKNLCTSGKNKTNATLTISPIELNALAAVT